jgi:hypothetical protein
MPLFRRDRPGHREAATEVSPARRSVGPAVDEAVGDEDGRRLVGHLRAGRWQDAHDVLESAGPFDREFLVDVAADLDGRRPEWLDVWVHERPSSPIPLLFRGAHGVRWAWQARGGGHADQVDPRAWDVFFGRLNAAERDLLEAARMGPEDPVPWCNLLISGRGLQISLEELCLRFEQATARERWLPYAHDQMLQGLCAKWFGTSDMMFHFARDTTEEAPEGASVHKVVALAHIEEWLYTGHPHGYFTDPTTTDEINAAADRSVFSPAFGGEKQSVHARHVFAMAFHLTGDRDRARTLFAQLGDVVAEFPWYYLGDPVEAFKKARADAA